ncbi:biotin--acetyl-CoA-carboxylase ligase [Nitrincola sp. A-D6]|uniref:FxsA family protein n=1 Tax=Nitrincola sp. A-D6 TaxID=1545442 RepID=UPI00051FE03A|nr:FxsA family protein [Nitrincola sp. A-D6]KGK41028.1 biotin--acetyl-CoA-carboxylase ligase [Nitrincola sp. A-D6]
MRVIFLLFIIVPIIEITLLINVGQMIGVWYTVGLVLLSAFIGVNMLRIQSLGTLMRARERMDQGEIPGQEMGEGIVLAVGGALLVTPGFVTDVVGFCCLIPYTRKALVHFLSQRMTVVTSMQATSTPPPHSPPFGDAPGHSESTPRSGDIIDGEYTRKD